MKSPSCQCAKKSKRKPKTTNRAKSKQVMNSKAEISKFSALKAPIMANTSGVFDRATLVSSRGGSISIPGFAPINAFPYPGISLGNTSQMYGLLTGSNLADLAAANIYRVQDRKDDVASGIGVTGLKPASRGNASGRNINMTSPNQPIISPTPPPRPARTGMLTPVKIKQEPTLDQIEADNERARVQGLRAAIFAATNPGKGDSASEPLNLTGIGAPLYVRQSQRPRTMNSTLFSPKPMTQ